MLTRVEQTVLGVLSLDLYQLLTQTTQKVERYRLVIDKGLTARLTRRLLPYLTQSAPQ